MQEEMKEWWRHHRSKIPNFENDADWTRIEDLTGCIPLLLRPLLKWHGKNFCEVKKNICMDNDILAVGRNIRNFAYQMKSKGDPEYERLVLKSRCPSA